MKRAIFLLLIILFQLKLLAIPVNLNDATQVADFFIDVNGKSNTIENVIEFENEEQITVTYIANLNPQGFIAVSTDTDIRPIVAYSFHNNFDYDSDPNNILYHMLLNDMTERINAMNSGILPNTIENNTLWSHYLNQNYTYFNQRDPQYWPPEGTTSTGGWLETAWHQNSPYKDFCPIDPETNARSVVGCVATALSQVLNFHEYIGNRIWNTENDGYISNEGDLSEVHIDSDHLLYDFPSFIELNGYLDDLRAHYISGIMTAQDTAAICFVSGIACEMNYSSQSSGTDMYSSILIDKFDYYTADEICGALVDVIINSLIPNMKNAQPAILKLKNDADVGHFVVCDGYQINDEDEDFFHINCGWGQYSGGNIQLAWYDLPDFPGTYNFYGNPILNISPPGYHGLLSGNISLNGGNGQLNDVTIIAGNKTTYPDETGYYEIELYNGNYDMEVFLWDYETVVTEVEVIANQNTNVDIDLNVSAPNYIYVPIHHTMIQEGINAAENGDIVIVLQGEYFENINFNGKKIKVVSWYYMNHNEFFIDNTIINGNMDGRVVVFDHCEDFNSSLEGFTITGGLPSGAGGNSHSAGIYCLYSSPTLKNLKITGNEAFTRAGLGLTYSDANIKDIVVFDNFNFFTYDTYGAIGCLNSNPIFENISIYDNNDAGIHIRMSNVIFNNLTICDNGSQGIYLYSGDLMMSNCLIWGNNSSGQQIYYNEPSSNLSINYSDIQGGCPPSVTGIGNIDAEPLLVDPTNGDFQPKWTATEFSPLIDTGNPFLQDPDGTRSDMGAVRAINHKVDSIELIDTIEGINWKCFPVLDNIYADADIAANVLYDIMLPPYPAALQLVETQDPNNNIYFDFPYWYNDNQQFTSVKGYKIHMNEAATLEITGFLEDPYKVITLEEGIENWIGYFPEVSMNSLDAFESVLDKINKIQTKDFTLVKTEFGWLGTGWTINYGDLVVVNCTEDCSFYWGEQGGGSVPIHIRSSSEGFSYDEEADYVPVFVELDPEALGNPTEIGIFVENECKGAEVIEDSLVQICAYVLNDSMVFDPGMVEFQLYYGSRSENVLIDSYSIKENLDDAGNIEKLDFSQNPQRFYIISLTDSGNNVPEVIKTSLEQNFPNPFNPITTINYSLAEEGDVELIVYNIKGQKVKTLVKEIKDSGHYQAIWDGTDNNKKQVASGVYLYRLSIGKKTLNKKMLLLK